MKIILASKNNDKIDEIKKILAKTNIDLVTSNDITFPDVEDFSEIIEKFTVFMRPP